MIGRNGHANKWSIGGAVIAALGASSCCLGPLLLGLLGLGGAGGAAALGAYRPYLLAATAVLLGAAFYFAYRKVPASDACGCERPRVNRVGRIGLWLATVLVLVTAGLPSLLARWGEHRPSSGAEANASVAKATIGVEGIDCEACAAPMRKALTKVGGFHALELDIERQSITVSYEPAAGRLEAYVAALNDLGYEAKLPSEREARR